MARFASRQQDPDVTARAPLETLLVGLVDFAGLFPPAALPMSDAVRQFAEYRAGPTAVSLGRFVVPVGRLGELAAQTWASAAGAPGSSAPTGRQVVPSVVAQTWASAGAQVPT